MIAEREGKGEIRNTKLEIRKWSLKACAGRPTRVGYTLGNAEIMSLVSSAAVVVSARLRKNRIIGFMNHLFLILTIVAYVGSLVLYLGFLNTGKEIPGGWGHCCLGWGWLRIILRCWNGRGGYTPFLITILYGSMSLFGWLLALTYLGLELFHRQRSVGAFVLPFILVFFVAAHLAPADRLSPAPAKGVIFAFHVTLSILAYAAFALSFVFSLIFLGEERLLRSRKMSNVVWRLPPLELA